MLNLESTCTNTQDITEQKHTKQALKASEEKYQFLFRNMLNGLAYCKIIFDKKGKPQDFIYINVNDAFEKLTGLKKVTIRGKRATEAIPEIKEMHPELFDAYGRVALTGKPENFEMHFKPLDIWLHISLYCPKKGYFVAIFDNITQRKQITEQLQTSEKRFRDTLDAMLEGCQLISYNWSYLYVNDTAVRQARISKEKLLGKTMMDAYPGIEKTELFFTLKKTMEERTPAIIENEFTFPEGDKGWFKLSIQPAPEGIVILSEDITKVKEAKKQLRTLTYQLNGLSPGGSFLCESHKRCFKAYADLAMHGVSGLCITREDPQTLIRDYGIKPESIRMLSAKSIYAFQILPDLQTVALAISEFLKTNHTGVVLLDGLEYLIARFGFNAVYALIQEKRFDFIENNALLLMPINMATINEKEKALLASETKTLNEETTTTKTQTN